MKKDYYEILEIERHASAEEIKRAYRTIAFANHPDKNPNNPTAEAIFKEASEAYDTLRDPAKKQHYDRYGHTDTGHQGFSHEDIFSQFGDIFGGIFGGFGGSQQAIRKGADLRYNLSITLQQAYTGDTVSLKIPTLIPCDDCSGSGCAKGGKRITCSYCHGTGQVVQQQGFFNIATPCAGCQGMGQTIDKPCPKCKASGVIETTKTLSLTIPKGVDTGIRMRVEGEGEAAQNNGIAGDLYVVISVEQDKKFIRRDNDLIVIEHISFIDAILGTTKIIETMNGEKEVVIPKGTQNDDVYTIKNAGMPYLKRNTQYGDLLIQIVVDIPKSITTEQENILKQYKELEEARPFQKLKKVGKKIGKAMGLSE